MMATRGACTEQGHLNKNLVVVVRERQREGGYNYNYPV